MVLDITKQQNVIQHTLANGARQVNFVTRVEPYAKAVESVDYSKEPAGKKRTEYITTRFKVANLSDYIDP